jgi:hypothetical protein
VAVFVWGSVISGQWGDACLGSICRRSGRTSFKMVTSAINGLYMNEPMEGMTVGRIRSAADVNVLLARSGQPDAWIMWAFAEHKALSSRATEARNWTNTAEN